MDLLAEVTVGDWIVGLFIAGALGYTTVQTILTRGRVKTQQIEQDARDAWWNRRNAELMKQLDDLMARVELSQEAHTECERKLARAEGRLDALEKVKA